MFALTNLVEFACWSFNQPSMNRHMFALMNFIELYAGPLVDRAGIDTCLPY